MYIKSSLLAALLLAGSSAAFAGGAGHAPGDRLVGMWETDIYVSPAACTPGGPPAPLVGHNTMVFNAGGTLVENPQVTPSGGAPGAAQVRSMGLGKWTYNPRTGQYRVLLRLEWYAADDGAWLGYQMVDRTILLSNDRNTAFGPVTSIRYAPNGSVLFKVCGKGVSRRL